MLLELFGSQLGAWTVAGEGLVMLEVGCAFLNYVEVVKEVKLWTEVLLF